MSAPRLRAIDPNHPSVRRAPSCLPALPFHDAALFLVVGEGQFLGCSYAVGDVLVCRGEARWGRATVLQAKHGRPRMGTVLGHRLVGDAGEACHPTRWRSMGELWGVFRRTGAGWQAEVAGMPRPASTPLSVDGVVATEQLQLFAA